MSILLAAFAAIGSDAPIVSLPSPIADDGIDGGFGEASAGLTLENDGDIITENSGDIGDWINPKSAAPGAYEARATLISGTLSSGTIDTWLAMTSNRAWTVSQSGAGTKNCSFTLEIRLGSTVLASSTVTLTATV